MACLWGKKYESGVGALLEEKCAVSVPYSWLQGEFDSFSSVTLKVSFSTPGCYRPDGFKPPPGGKGKKGGGKSQSSELGCFWVETKMTYRLSTDTGWCCVTHCRNKHKREREKKESALFNLCHSREFYGLGCKGPVNTHCNGYNNILLRRSRTM